jgi:2-polyprenyl-3-methyl-5-hydroxy-6-metoxy-1,4-benzoquinol methylase
LSDGWELAEHVAETLDIGPGTRVFEVDCGDGSFLVPLHQNGYIVGGIDGDPAAIAQAIAAMPDGLFQIGMAPALDPAVPWDVVVCRSLGAAPDLDYLRGLIARMFAKATHAIAVLNVPEARRTWLLHALAEAGAKAIQFEPAVTARQLERVEGGPESDSLNVFARV